MVEAQREDHHGYQQQGAGGDVDGRWCHSEASPYREGAEENLQDQQTESYQSRPLQLAEVRVFAADSPDYPQDQPGDQEGAPPVQKLEADACR